MVLLGRAGCRERATEDAMRETPGAERAAMDVMRDTENRAQKTRDAMQRARYTAQFAECTPVTAPALQRAIAPR